MPRPLLALSLLLVSAVASAEPKPYRLPPVDLKQDVIWGSEASAGDKFKLAFGGLDQQAWRGTPRTRYYDGTEWHSFGVSKRTPYRQAHRSAQAQSFGLSIAARVASFAYFSDVPLDQKTIDKQLENTGSVRFDPIDAKELVEHWRKLAETASPYEKQQLLIAAQFADSAREIVPARNRQNDAVEIGKYRQGVRLFDQAAAALGDEPPPRALSPLVYDPHTRLFVLFGGDHLDYLTNDLWVFDPATKAWQQRHPPQSPAPRANHKWEVLPEGKLKLTGGYTYTSNTGYVSGQYIGHEDGEYVYDIAANRWTGGSKELVSPWERIYRTGPFDPHFFLEWKAPDADHFAAWLKDVPANTWTKTNPPRLPELNRDWGTAVLAGDVILRWSGGHSAHGGTDVLHYHTRTNRWELTDHVEFPLGQLYANTDYPAGTSFNGRPWITGHTYQSYAWSPQRKSMWFVGQEKHAFRYEPHGIGWWPNPYEKPQEMVYDSCFYTLTLCDTPHGIVCWTQEGKIFVLPPEGEEPKWQEWELSGEKLPGSRVDNSTLAYDSKRDLLYFVRKEYGDDHRFDGAIHTLDVKTRKVAKLTPAGCERAGNILYLCQLRYDAVNDLLLCGCTLPPDESGLRRTPAYDPEKNRWVSLKITGDDPNGPKGRNVSLGLMYDAKQKLFWAVDTNSQVYVLRLEAGKADMKDL